MEVIILLLYIQLVYLLIITKCLERRVRFIHWLTIRPGKEIRHRFQCVNWLISRVIAAWLLVSRSGTHFCIHFW